MEEALTKKSSSLTISSKRKSELTKSSRRTSKLMLSESPRVRESQESSRDTVLSTCKRRPTEVGEESDVSEDGIPLTLDSPSAEQVNWVTTTEPRSTRRSTESAKVQAINIKSRGRQELSLNQC